LARIHEFRAKQWLQKGGIRVPLGSVGRDPGECSAAAAGLGGAVVLKTQAWGTNRKSRGGIGFAKNPEEARWVASEIFARLGNAPLLVEEAVDVRREFYVGMIVDDRLRRPVLLASNAGGSGIEERKASVERLTIEDLNDPGPTRLSEFAQRADVPEEVATVALQLWRIARQLEARSAEINPLALAGNGELVALDCRISIDDYAVFRHPELEIGIPREFSGVPTVLDRIAWSVEADDYRGTFYFMDLKPQGSSQPRIGFHGCGGGGAMAAMDVLSHEGLDPANFADTSGNPAASKVYRAAKIILSQAGIEGYFLCGSGVASQDQAQLARALVKAFREDKLSIPVVLRLGGNGEEEAAFIVRRFAREAGVAVEAYQKEHTTKFCTSRMRELISAAPRHTQTPPARGPAREFRKPYSFATRTGRITYDHAVCGDCESKACVTACKPNILKSKDGLPVLAITEVEAERGRCTECLACEAECWYQGLGGAAIDLPIAGLDKFRSSRGHID
jgi:succinyl-CoA synthetase beta subunit